MNGYLWLVLIVVVLFALDRFFLWLEARGMMYWRRIKPSGSSISPMIAMDVAFQPGKKYVLEQLQEGKKECSDEEDGEDDKP